MNPTKFFYTVACIVTEIHFCDMYCSAATSSLLFVYNINKENYLYLFYTSLFKNYISLSKRVKANNTNAF